MGTAASLEEVLNSNQPDNLVTAGTVGNTVPAASHEKTCRQETDLASKPSPTTIEANNDITTSTRQPLQQPKLRHLSTTNAIGMYSITKSSWLYNYMSI